MDVLQLFFYFEKEKTYYQASCSVFFFEMMVFSKVLIVSETRCKRAFAAYLQNNLFDFDMMMMSLLLHAHVRLFTVTLLPTYCSVRLEVLFEMKT